MAAKLSPALRRRAALLGCGALLAGDRRGAGVCFGAALTGFREWEGAEHNRLRDRPGRRLAGMDTDLNYGVREDLLSEARNLGQTYPIAKAIKEQFADYVVGQCNIKWNTGDSAVDAAYEEGWKAWQAIADFKGVHRFAKLVKLAVGQCFEDGNIFGQYIDSGSFLQINMIESDRVSSAGIFNFDMDNMVAGIGVDPVTRRPKFIRVWQRTLYGTFQNPVEIPVQNYFHLFNPPRVDAVSGVTGYFAVLNALRDMKEIVDAERIKTKRHSRLALLAKVGTGQAPAVSVLDNEIKEDKQGVTVERTADGSTAYMFTTEDLKAFESTTPGQAWQGHMEFIVRNIAIGTGLPYGVVWSMAGMNKPAVLVELRKAERTITSWQDEVEGRMIRPCAGRWLAKEVKNGRLPFNANWYKFSIGRPPYISIDAGRDSQAAQNENKLAMRSLKTWYMETEEDWQDEIKQCVIERSFLEQQCALQNPPVDPNNVRMMQQTGSSSTKDLGSGSGANADE